MARGRPRRRTRVDDAPAGGAPALVPEPNLEQMGRDRNLPRGRPRGPSPTTTSSSTIPGYLFFLAEDFFVDFLAGAFLVDFFALAFLVDFLAGAFLVDFLVDFLLDFLVDFLAGMFTSFRGSGSLGVGSPRASSPTGKRFGCSKAAASRSHALEPAPLPLAHAAPHAVSLVAAQGVVQALDADGALGADALGLPRRPPLLGKEDLGVVISAPGSVLPWNEMMHGLPPKLHSCNSGPTHVKNASPFARDLSASPAS
jgi:hypothetical protein